MSEEILDSKERGPYILPQEPFRFLILQEVLRAHRTEACEGFAVVLLTETLLKPDKAWQSNMAKLIRSVARESDTIGQFDGETLGVILSDIDYPASLDVFQKIKDTQKDFSTKIDVSYYPRVIKDPFVGSDLPAMICPALIFDHLKMLNTYFMLQEPFCYLLDRACSGGLRHYMYVSIVVIHIKDGKLKEHLSPVVASLLRGQLRMTDVLGVLNEGQLGIMLYDAEVSQAEKIAMRVQSVLQDKIPGLELEGWACFPTDAHSSEDLLKAAQERKAKSGA